MHYFKLLCLESVSSQKLYLECCVLEKTTVITASIVAFFIVLRHEWRWKKATKRLEVPFVGHCVASKPLSVVNTALDWLPSLKIIGRKLYGELISIAAASDHGTKVHILIAARC